MFPFGNRDKFKDLLQLLSVVVVGTISTGENLGVFSWGELHFAGQTVEMTNGDWLDSVGGNSKVVGMIALIIQ